MPQLRLHRAPRRLVEREIEDVDAAAAVEPPPVVRVRPPEERRLGVEERVAAAAAEHEVVAEPVHHQVAARAAGRDVVAVGPRDHVVAAPAVHPVVARAARDDVAALAGENQIVAEPGKHRVRAAPGEDPVVPRPGEDEVVTRPGPAHLVLRPEEDEVVRDAARGEGPEDAVHRRARVQEVGEGDPVRVDPRHHRVGLDATSPAPPAPRSAGSRCRAASAGRGRPGSARRCAGRRRSPPPMRCMSTISASTPWLARNAAPCASAALCPSTTAPNSGGSGSGRNSGAGRL